MGLVEVMVSAMLTIVIALAIFSSLDNASATSGLNKSRAIAAGLAQQDLERMRSLKVAQLSAIDATAPTVVGGVTYQVTSSSEWVSDDSGAAAEGCSAAGGQADYLKITSSVTWPVMQGRDPVSVSSLVAPPVGSFGVNQGTLVIHIRDRNGTGIPNLAVNVSGPSSSASETTDDEGCVMLGYLPVGSYTISFSQPGYIDPSGTQSVTRTVSVLGQTVTSQEFKYDQPGSLPVNFRQGPSVIDSSNGSWVTITNAGLPTGRLTFPVNPAAPSKTIGNLFPFPDGYGVYSGDCTGANPSLYGSQPSPVGIVPPASAAAPVDVPEPRIRIVVRYGTSTSSTVVSGALVTLTKAFTTGCSGLMSTQTTDAAGRLPDEYQPYGTYLACARHSTGRKAYALVSNTQADAAGMGSDSTILISSSSSTGQNCP